MCSLGLAHARDIVILALDRHQADISDQLWPNGASAVHQFALGQQVLLEDDVDGLEIEFLGQVADREVLVIEFQMGLGFIAITIHEVLKIVQVRLAVAFDVHRHEAVELDKARIDPATGADIGRGHGEDHVGLEPGKGPLLGQLVGHGRRQARIDGRAHEGHA